MGSGKSLLFSIPFVLHKTDVALRVTPLTVLMIDQGQFSILQVVNSNFHTVAIYSETLAAYKAMALYEVQTWLHQRRIPDSNNLLANTI
jgi:superfamily II DNA helicase RecQ